LPNVLEAAGTGRLRIFGPGTNRICFTHVDNYAHGLIIAEKALCAENLRQTNHFLCFVVSLFNISASSAPLFICIITALL
jgi:hypothetical protein